MMLNDTREIHQLTRHELERLISVEQSFVDSLESKNETALADERRRGIDRLRQLLKRRVH